MNEFVSWDYLLTFGGCMTVTAIITQFVKKISFLQKVDTQIISYVIAVVILTISQLATHDFSWNSLALDLVNGIVIALASNGVYDATKTIVNTVTNI